MSVSVWFAAASAVCLVVVLVMGARPSLIARWPLVGIAAYVGMWGCLAVVTAIEGAYDLAGFLGLMAVVPVVAMLWPGRGHE